MPGISTEYLAEQIEASNDRLTKALESLTNKVEKGQDAFNALRVDLAEKLGSIQNSMGWIKGITVLVILPIALGLAAFSYKAADRAARIEESVVALRDHAREQDARIAKLIELQAGPYKHIDNQAVLPERDRRKPPEGVEKKDTPPGIF